MYHVYKTGTLDYPRRKIFSLVNDVDDYSQFLPWCEKAQIEREYVSESKNIYIASIHFKLGFIRQKFTTINEKEPFSKVYIRLKDGPFKTLNGLWIFEKTAKEQTKITLKMEFEFSNPIIEKTFGKTFNIIAQNLLSSFIKRAHQVL